MPAPSSSRRRRSRSGWPCSRPRRCRCGSGVGPPFGSALPVAEVPVIARHGLPGRGRGGGAVEARGLAGPRVLSHRTPQSAPGPGLTTTDWKSGPADVLQFGDVQVIGVREPPEPIENGKTSAGAEDSRHRRTCCLGSPRRRPGWSRSLQFDPRAADLAQRAVGVDRERRDLGRRVSDRRVHDTARWG